MKLIAISQRVTSISEYSERRDSLDQRWLPFLEQCNLAPILIPNRPELARELLVRTSIEGILLTGGNDLALLGGDAPERDETERILMEYGLRHRIPILGICRGMQFILHYFEETLVQVPGHISPLQNISIRGNMEVVNSYHSWGCISVSKSFEVWAIALDGVIEGITHNQFPIAGIMWHPERHEPIAKRDISLFRNFFLRE